MEFSLTTASSKYLKYKEESAVSLAPKIVAINIECTALNNLCVQVDEYGTDTSASDTLLQMLDAFMPPTFEMLNQEKGLQNHPDTIDDLFRLCCR